jgi:hypothetical protein
MKESFSEGNVVAILATATDIHIEPAAVPGQRRGALVHLEILNGSGGALTMTVDVGGSAEDLLVATTGKEAMDVWVPAGATLSINGSGTGGSAFGYVEPSA